MVICIAEDRKYCETAIKLLLLSILRHGVDAPVELFYPAADGAFRVWLGRCQNVRLNAEPLPDAGGFNVKPHALLDLLDRGYDEVVWVDSDILIARDFRPIFAGLPVETMVVAEEALYGAHEDPDGMRARNWGFETGRILPFCINSCVLRVTPLHRPLLERWRDLLQTYMYRVYQKYDWGSRPPHMFGDQDVLTALLASREFSDIPVRILLRGPDILQFFGPCGYTVAERAAHLVSGLPPFVHAQVVKPWNSHEVTGGRTGGRSRQYFVQLYRDLSPYTIEAGKFSDELEEDCSWMKPRVPGGTLLRLAGLGYAPLVGLPLAAIADTVRFARNLRPSAKRTTAGISET
jgi:hypothetical protein